MPRAKEAALQALDASSTRADWLALLQIEPRLDDLLADQRFESLCIRGGLG